MSEAPENRTDQETGGRFQPGRSGNPGGRPGVSKRIRELAQDHSEEALLGLVKEARTAETSRDRQAAWNSILDRGLGKATIGTPDDEGRQAAIFQILTGVPR
ncbi:hypothetical protein UFOVP78_18 [uncultured Caudovirales phage]|uniref:DUF5681 domain-containing protein n=1 Tax=uncultured Caudovirales phage TaxID=2100421 RepID=A0A6J5L0N1_9CAUD|nr:hypothetical protein UFOVP78_18 [uncultured Caudovirales phage]